MSSLEHGNDESEGENEARVVLDVDGDFYLPGLEMEGSNGTATFKLPQLRTILKPAAGILVNCRPVPRSASVARATSAMGHGQNDVWTASNFQASDSPEFMFPARMINTSERRFLNRFCIRRRFVPQVTGLKTMMIYADGACCNNGSAEKIPRGGYAFVFNNSPTGTYSSGLEKKGVDGQVYAHTNNRAELRAIIAALHFRTWWGEGWERIVMVTDSEYVSKGGTEWLRSWAGRNWRTSGGKQVANQDLWKALSEVLGSYAKSGCEVSFWTVPRNYNTLADAAAKAAADQANGAEEYINDSRALI
ncbi:ribonuclease H-like domain-containing protein [Annulohypoxylon truncatum]|uniref:ribonuclease H-like domain-containing protein n=1 Tax=Annulohypoxylon truncatum TaxID=327061 RepID=UPI0020079DB9|nr:ribonuclease H-like domain-containing protein [Annulohypoxylon truncatum]KAI1213244.1 ribonuclease H-like domain-containing protein [Annulohypoxylon truncatum]